MGLLRSVLEMMQPKYITDAHYIASPQFTPALHKLVEEAAHDTWLGEFVKSRKPEDFVGFFVSGHPVGFAIPRQDSDGYYRTGAIYVTPRFRQHNIARGFIIDYFKDRKGRAYIDPNNQASIALYTSVGFTKTRRSVKDGGNTLLFEYLKEK